MKSISLLAAFLLSGVLFSQAQEKNKEAEQIIITKKGTGNEKLNIVIDGDKVTLNGEPLSKDSNVTVTRHKIKDLAVWNADGAIPGNKQIIIRPQHAPQFPNKAMLGVVTQKTDRGAQVMSVTDESAATKAGLKQGDIITEVDKNKIATPDDLSKNIKDKSPGDKITIVYLRDKKQHTTIAELTKWKAPEILAFGNRNMREMPNIDIQQFMQRIPRNFENGMNNIQPYKLEFQSFGPKIGIKIQDLELGEGVKIIEVEEGSDAAKAGLRKGDIIKKVNGKEIAGADDMRSKVLGIKPGDSLSVELNRNGKIQKANVQLSKKIKTADL